MKNIAINDYKQDLIDNPNKYGNISKLIIQPYRSVDLISDGLLKVITFINKNIKKINKYHGIGAPPMSTSENRTLGGIELLFNNGKLTFSILINDVENRLADGRGALECVIGKKNHEFLNVIMYHYTYFVYHYWNSLLLKEVNKSKENKNKRLVKKPRGLANSELVSHLYVQDYYNNEPDIFTNQFNEKELKEILEKKQLFQLCNSYGFLTDGILSYLFNFSHKQDYSKVTISNIIPENQDDFETKEVISIKDKWTDFCKEAGADNPNWQNILLDEIKKNKFSVINLYNTTQKKKEFVFTEANFMSYQLTYKKMDRLKNLKNVSKSEAIDTIELTLNKGIFDSVLLKSKNTNTQGYLMYPYQLEKQLRDTVSKYEVELRTFCKDNQFKHLTGGRYSVYIRAFYNLLLREEIIKDLTITKPVESYAFHCCHRAFQFDKKKMKNVFKKKSMAKEYLDHSIEILKYLVIEGNDKIDIKEHFYIGNNIRIVLNKSIREKKKPDLVDTSIRK